MNILCLRGALLFLCFFVSVESYFTIIGPRTVKYKSIYKCTLTTTYLAKEKASVTITFTGNTTKEEIVSDSYPLDPNFENKTIDIDLSSHNHVENFTLSAVLNSKKEIFSQTVEVFVIPKRYSVFIQTDKPVYKPGDEILYRILVLDSDLKPYDVEEGNLNHTIHDESGNILPEPKSNDNDDEQVAPESHGPDLSEDGFDDDEDEITNEANPSNNDFPDNLAPKERKNNLIDKVNGKITTGVYSYSYQLNEEPVEGNWSIRVTIDNEEKFTTIQKFEVKRYILPRFEVFIDTKHHVSKDEGDVLLNVYANYTFGKFVKGTAKVTAIVYDRQHPDIIHREVTKHIDVDMKTPVSFTMESDLKIFNEIRPYEIKFVAEFTETLTGQVMFADTIVKVHRYNQYTTRIVRERKRFKPGFPYNFEVHVMQANGEPAPKSSESLQVSIKYHYKPIMCTRISQNEKLITNFEFMDQKLLIDGKARFTLNVYENTTAFTINAKYFESSTQANVSRHETEALEYMKIEHEKKFVKGVYVLPKVGDIFKIKVKVTIGVTVNKLYYVVISRNEVVAEKMVKPTFDKISNTAVFPIEATNDMTPSCRVIVYYIQPAGEIVYDQITVEVPTRSFFTMGMLFQDEKKTKMPGQSCKLKTEALPGSFVSLLGVDQSVKLLGHGNDIDRARVSADMKLYDSSTYAQEIDDETSKFSDFSESNAFIITNAYGYKANCSFLERLTDDGYNEDVLPPDDFEEGDEDIPDGSQVRTVFPETWIFKDFKIGANGKFILNTVVPDTITSFIVSGFAVHPKHGLSVAVPRKITVFKEFFAKLYIPYSIRLHEILKVDVSVFNYLSANKGQIQATVVLTGQDEFEFVDVDMTSCTFTPARSAKDQSRTISVPYNNGASTYFLIRAKKIGLMKLSVQATTTASTDKLERSVKVEREGYRQTLNKAYNIDMRNRETFSDFFRISFPSNSIGDSHQISASVIGDLLGPALINVNSLMRMPGGCTEQTFKSFIPNIVAMKYLKAIGKLTGSYKTNGESYLTHGHQELLKRKLGDGSFSLWGEKGAASVWLTAYVAKVLGHTKEYVSVNDMHIFEALDFVRKHQDATTGGFSDANVHNYIYISKTASQRGMALSAFIAIAFMENPDHIKDFKATIDKTMDYLSGHVVALNDSLSMSMAAYAFALHKNKGVTEDIFKNLEKISNRGETKMYWDNSSPSVQVETAAYTVMALVTIGEAQKALHIVNWLASQRQTSGSFHATTDTVIGIQALAMYATAVHAPQKNVNVVLSYEKNRKAVFDVDEGNALVLQSKALKPDARTFGLTATGEGFAYFQLTYSCNINVEDPERSFEIKAETVPNGKDDLLHLKICASFIPNGTQAQSGMTLIEIYLPSGYEYDKETEELVKKVGVKRVETAHQKTVIILYFNTMTSTKVCPEIKATRKNVVENLRSSPIKIYDYYQQKLRASTFFSVKDNKKCGF